jgi:hypothetical protein
MENQGAKPVDLKHPAMQHGDVVVYPGYRGSAGSPDTNASGLIATLTFFPNPHLATMDRPLGAGFYAASIGPLPFAAGKVEPSRYEVYQAK